MYDTNYFFLVYQIPQYKFNTNKFSKQADDNLDKTLKYIFQVEQPYYLSNRTCIN